MTRLAKFLTRIIDWFYFPFLRKLIPLQTFRYAVCGGINLVFGWVLYYLFFHYVFMERELDLGWFVVAPYTAPYIAVLPITLFTGFCLNKYVAFKMSPLRGHTQIMRYILSVAGAVMIDYAFLKIFVEAFGIFPTPSKMLATVIVTVYSYLMQKYFTFRNCVDV